MKPYMALAGTLLVGLLAFGAGCADDSGIGIGGKPGGTGATATPTPTPSPTASTGGGLIND